MAYPEEVWLDISGIQHFLFCRRQWALIHFEQQWQENLRTVEGQIVHEKCHDGHLRESRGDLLVARALRISSAMLGVSGVCDVVEFRRGKSGAQLHGREGFWQPVPIEYKRGKPKEGLEDVAQLVVQALCLSEMFCCEVPVGYLFYDEIHRREKIEITSALQSEVRLTLEEMHRAFARGVTPKGKATKKCQSCSLKDLCLPKLEKIGDVSAYYAAAMKGA
ncbi:MAG: CRISPR-associated protein Cas4 [Schwartzia sp. (in: firmicutes)]